MKSILRIKRIIFFLFIHILLLSFHSMAQTILFSEDWSSGNFSANNWTFSPNQITNWKDSTAYIPTGASSPCALFFWAPQINTSYTNSLVSPIIQSASYNNLTLSFKMHYEYWPPITPHTQEEFKVEYKSVGSSTWTTLITYDNNNSLSLSYNNTVTNQSLTGVTGNIQIRFRVNGDNTHNIQGWTVDDIVVKGTLLSACSGAPTVSIAANSYNYCTTATTNPILTATPGTLSSGYTYQWQSRAACTGNAFTDIGGATTANYFVPAITTANDYRVKITCTGSSLSAFSNVVNIYPACYCQSEASSSSGADIGYVFINGFVSFSNPTSTTQYVNNSAANKQYTDYSYVTPLQVIPGSLPAAYYITQINSTATQTSAYLKVYIDLNRDGDFTDAGEQVNSGASSAAGTPSTPNSISGTLSIPTTTTLGYTKMRLVFVEGGSATTVNSCSNSYTKGETEDYTVLIRPATTQSVSATNSGPLCLSTATSVQLFANPTAGMGCPVFAWTGPNGFTSSAQNPIINNPTSSNLGTYSVTVTTYGNNYSVYGSTSVTQVATPVINQVNTTNPTACGSSNGSLSLTGLTSNTLYSVSYTYNSNPINVSLTSNGSGIITISNLGAGTYNNINVSIGGCSSTNMGPYSLSAPLTNPPSASNNGPTCAGNNLTLNASSPSSSATYLWSGPGGFTSTQQNPTINSTTIANSGTYYVTVTANGCTSTAATTLVTIYPNPVINAISIQNPTGCGYSNGSFTLQGLQPNTTYIVNYSYYSTTQPSITLTSNSLGNLIVPNLIAGFYNAISAKDSIHGCISAVFPSGVWLVNPPNPAQPNASSNTPVCTGGTLNLFTNTVTNGTYSWIGPGGFSSTQQNPVISSVNTANAGNYYVTVTINNCVSIPDTISVLINNAPPPPSISYNNPACAGGTLQLSAANVPSATYHWSGPNGFSSTTQNPLFSNATVSLSGTYYLYTIANGCQSTTGSLSVAVHLVPQKPSVVNDTFCQYATTIPLSAIGQNLLWYNSPSAINGSPNAPTPSSVNTGTFTWYVTQSDSGCQSLKQPISVLVKPTPQPPTVNPPVVLYCQYNTAVPLTASGQNLLWYSSPSGGTGASSAPTPNTSILGTSTFYVSQSLNGCESNRTTISYTVLAKPDTPKVNNPFQFCVSQTNAFVSAQGTQLKWYTSPISTFGSSTPPTINTSVAGTTVYYVSQTAGNNCESDRSRVEVIVHENVKAEVSIVNHIICQYDTIIINNIATSPSNPTTANYVWDFDGGVVISGTGGGPWQVRWDVPGHKKISVSVGNFTCTATDDDTLFVKPSPLGDFELKNDACINEPMYVQAAWNSMTATDYYWDFTDAIVMNQASGAGAYKIKFTTPGLHFVTLKTQINGCYSWPYFDTINIHDYPYAKIELLNSGIICKDDSIHFKMQGTTYPNYSYTWTPNEFFPINGLPEAVAIMRAPDMVKLSVIDQFGCVGIDSMYVNAENCCNVSLPTAFTPNHDGKNDFFRIISQGKQTISVFRVVNRWGQTLFETANPEIGWDGTSNGAEQDMGTYFYFLRYSCGTDELFEKKGEVILVR